MTQKETEERIRKKQQNRIEELILKIGNNATTKKTNKIRTKIKKKKQSYQINIRTFSKQE